MSRDAEWARNVVARQAIANAAAELEWGLYPEIGERDWLKIQGLAEKILVVGIAPSTQDFKEAYALLEGRANAGKDGEDAGA